MDKAEAVKIGPQTGWDHVVSMFTQTFDDTAWWILLALVIAVVGFFMLKFVPKVMLKWVIALVFLSSASAYIAAPYLIEYFKVLPPGDFLVGFFVGGAVVALVSKVTPMWIACIIALCFSITGWAWS